MSLNLIDDSKTHKVPKDLGDELIKDSLVKDYWNSLTPLARNEYICWIENAKQADTRMRRIVRTKQELLQGKRRPCCWVGCVHRKDKPLSPTQQWITSKE